MDHLATSIWVSFSAHEKNEINAEWTLNADELGKIASEMMQKSESVGNDK